MKIVSVVFAHFNCGKPLVKIIYSIESFKLHSTFNDQIWEYSYAIILNFTIFFLNFNHSAMWSLNTTYSLLQSFTAPKALILTQFPLKDTEVDLWRLCMDHDVHAMVILCDNNEVEHLFSIAKRSNIHPLGRLYFFLFSRSVTVSVVSNVHNWSQLHFPHKTIKKTIKIRIIAINILFKPYLCFKKHMDVDIWFWYTKSFYGKKLSLRISFEGIYMDSKERLVSKLHTVYPYFRRNRK